MGHQVRSVPLSSRERRFWQWRQTARPQPQQQVPQPRSYSATSPLPARCPAARLTGKSQRRRRSPCRARSLGLTRPIRNGWVWRRPRNLSPPSPPPVRSESQLFLPWMPARPTAWRVLQSWRQGQSWPGRASTRLGRWSRFPAIWNHGARARKSAQHWIGRPAAWCNAVQRSNQPVSQPNPGHLPKLSNVTMKLAAAAADLIGESPVMTHEPPTLMPTVTTKTVTTNRRRTSTMTVKMNPRRTSTMKRTATKNRRRTSTTKRTRTMKRTSTMKRTTNPRSRGRSAWPMPPLAWQPRRLRHRARLP